MNITVYTSAHTAKKAQTTMFFSLLPTLAHVQSRFVICHIVICLSVCVYWTSFFVLFFSLFMVSLFCFEAKPISAFVLKGELKKRGFAGISVGT